jgi:hypothetical protein
MTNTHSEPSARGSPAFHSKGAGKEKPTMVDARKYFGVTFVTLEISPMDRSMR